MDTFLVAEVPGQVIVVLLFVGSILVWSVMLTKWVHLRAARIASDQFTLAYRKEGTPAALFVKRQRFGESPLYAVYESACKVLGGAAESRGGGAEDLFMGGVGEKQHFLNPAQMHSVRNAVRVTLAAQTVALQDGLAFLAVAAVVAPLSGLLGTAWGVQEALGRMAATKSESAVGMAPALSAAVLPTVVGLLVALPTVIGCGVLSVLARRLCAAVDRFADDLVTDIARHYAAENDG